MKRLQKSCLLQSKDLFLVWSKQTKIIFILFACSLSANAQIINYVNNPSFEMALPSVTTTAFEAAKFWGAIDSIGNNSHILRTRSLGTVPIGFGGYQQPKSGNNFIVSEFYCNINTCGSQFRWYPRNRLKRILKPNTAYCAKYYVVNTNNNVVGINTYGAYFGNSTLDSIKYCSYALTYLNPQVENQNGIITDTLNWIAITGTFTANGSEKYMVLGNFRSNAQTTTMVINPTFLPNESNDNLIDDVSLIELDLPAFAGRDTSCIPGTTIYLGRQSDIGIDEACKWYKLPIVITPTTPALDTAAGIWVSPTQTSTYVVRQDICGMIKFDTVVVYKDAVGLEKMELLNESVNVFPNPASESTNIKCDIISDGTTFNVIILNQFGEVVKEEEVIFRNKIASIKTSELPQGVYFITLCNSQNETITKKLLIAK